MSEHWMASLRPGDTVLWVRSVRRQVASSRNSGEASIVRVTRGPSRAGYIIVDGRRYGPSKSLLNRVRIFEKARAGQQQSSTSEITWLEQDTTANRAIYRIKGAGAGRSRVRKKSADPQANREKVRQAAIQKRALMLHQIVEAIMASNAGIPDSALAQWRLVQQEIAAAVQAAPGARRRKSS